MWRKLACPLVVLAAACAAMTGAGETATAEELRVGLVKGPATGYSYDRLAVAGLRRAINELGVEGKVLTPSPKEGYLPSLLFLARSGYDLVIAANGYYASELDRAAVAFPAVRFAVLDIPFTLLRHRPRNALGVTFAAHEAAYLAGYLAGRMERRRPGRDVVSSVGGMKVPPIDMLIAGYQAGARKAARRIVTRTAYTGSFTDPAKCRLAALQQIARGSGVVFPVAGACGLGALEAARQKGVWGIGVDADEAIRRPHVLTSVLKKVDVAVYTAIREQRFGRLRTGRTLVLGLGQGGVGLGRISAEVPASLVAQVARIRKQIVAGTITVPTAVR